jgi:uncharacterized membrane protein
MKATLTSLTENPQFLELYYAMTERFKLHALLFASAALGMAMVFVRIHFSGTLSYTFLVWNLFLAVIPFGISSLLIRFARLSSSNGKPPAVVFYPLAALWLLFFPNAPYVLTDLLHLRPVIVPLWYDLLLLLSFAWTSLMFGFVSLSDMQQLVKQRFNAATGWLFACAALLLSSFGIYLGRFLRWNSWDVLTEPQQLVRDILERVVNPLAHVSAYGFTVLLTAFLLLAYLMLQYFKPKESLRQ